MTVMDVTVQVECLLNNGISEANTTIVNEVQRRLLVIFGKMQTVMLKRKFHGFMDDEILRRIIQVVRICECSDENADIIEHERVSNFIFSFYRHRESSAVDESICKPDTCDDFYSTIQLPSAHFEGLWESLNFEGSFQLELLDYISTIFLIDIYNVQTHMFGLNKLVLLHGPPGSGKTSLCKALCQKIAIRTNQYAGRSIDIQFVEINCNNLFSKWFSESAKLVLEMFEQVRRLAENGDNFVCILIDEVESISVSRKSLFKGSEPSDSIRAVNVLLTQLDQIKLISNILVLSTSNLVETIDPAFIDRVDCVYEIGLPGISARYFILASGIHELMRVGLVEEKSIANYSLAKISSGENDLQKELLELSAKSESCSGRFLTKLPLMAFSFAKKNSTLPIKITSLMESFKGVLNKAKTSRTET